MYNQAFSQKRLRKLGNFKTLTEICFLISFFYFVKNIAGAHTLTGIAHKLVIIYCWIYKCDMGTRLWHELSCDNCYFLEIYRFPTVPSSMFTCSYRGTYEWVLTKESVDLAVPLDVLKQDTTITNNTCSWMAITWSTKTVPF